MSALGDLGYLSSAYQAKDEEMTQIREAVATAIVTALRAGFTPTQVAEASPFTASYVRKIARANGIEAA